MTDSNTQGDAIKKGKSPKVQKEAKSKSRLKQIGLPVIAVLAGLLLVNGLLYGYLYASTPAHLRYPKYEHYHIRTQIVVDGKSVDFSQKEYQEEYDAGSCSAELTGQPVDFHDNQDQVAHIHWRGITGGEFLKFYGLNLIGGEGTSLGNRYDQGMMQMNNIETAGKLLPTVPADAKYFVYIGDKENYKQMAWDDFLNQDLEDFMGKKSSLNKGDKSSFNIFDMFSQKAFAHGMVDDGHNETVTGQDKEAQLERINNLIGNVVIFAQKNEPTPKQIQDRFNKLVPLHDSVCGG